MSTRMIPAARGTFILKHIPPRDYRKIPVIGWAIGDSGLLRPLTAEPFGRAVIEYPCGRIFDQASEMAFDSIVDWWAEVRI